MMTAMAAVVVVVVMGGRDLGAVSEGGGMGVGGRVETHVDMMGCRACSVLWPPS